MVQTPVTQIACPNCRQPFGVHLEQVIDATRDPAAKARFLAGRTNMVTCPNCGYQSRLATPLVYHDLSKELLLVHIPMELGLQQTERERIIGSFTTAIVNSLPAEQRKGYLFTPKMALTMQGMLETILEADGITKDVIEARRVKIRLIETFLQTEPEQWPELVKEHDDKLDREFFDIMTASAESALSNGRQDVAEHVLVLRDQLLNLSTVGKELLENADEQEAAIQDIADQLNALGDKVDPGQLVELAMRVAEDGDDRLQVLVGMARPILDYTFFQTFTAQIDAAEGEQKEAMTNVRDRLLELTSMVDQHNEALINQAAQALQEIVGSEDPDEAIRANIDMIDDTFLALVSANIKNAEQKGDQVAAARFNKVFERIMAILQESAPPEVQFINQLLQASSLEEARQKLREGATKFGPMLVQYMDMLIQSVAERGGNQAMGQRLVQLRQEAEKILAEAPAGQDAGAPKPIIKLEVPNAASAPRAEPPTAPSASDEENSGVTKSGIILPFSPRKRK